MSSEEKRTAYSIYLTPKADEILKGYVKGSGFVSISRTVEEMIIGFDSIYRIFHVELSPPELVAQMAQNPAWAILWTNTKVILNRLKRADEVITTP